jgi:hypothetical protein
MTLWHLPHQNHFQNFFVWRDARRDARASRAWIKYEIEDA